MVDMWDDMQKARDYENMLRLSESLCPSRLNDYKDKKLIEDYKTPKDKENNYQEKISG